MAAAMVKGRAVPPEVSFDINPTSRQVLADLMRDGSIAELIQAGGRLHQTGCNGCNGMGQAPASGKNSLRTTPRNFPGRSGNKDDRVYLCSPETAAASALTGQITDPRELGLAYPKISEPEVGVALPEVLQSPLPPEEASKVKLAFGPNIARLSPIMPLPDEVEVPVLLFLGDDISTDTISPAGAEALPYRSNLEGLANFSFRRHDETYVPRAKATKANGGHAIVGGVNYGQGSSREHAALAPQFLGLRLALVKSFARIHEQNLVNAGVLPLTFADADDYDRLSAEDMLAVRGIRAAVKAGPEIVVEVVNKGIEIAARHSMSARQVEIFLAGGLVNWFRERANS
jgi:aconitate hydratase